MRNFFLSLFERLETSINKFNGNGNGNGNGKYPIPELSKGDLRFESMPVRTNIHPVSTAKNPLDIGIHRSQHYLLKNQSRSDGHWVGILEADTTITSDYIMLMHFLGKIDPEKQKMAANLIREHQLSDGGWNIYYGGPSEISASVKAYFALKLAAPADNMKFALQLKFDLADVLTKCAHEVFSFYTFNLKKKSFTSSLPILTY